MARVELQQSYEEVAIALEKPNANAARVAVARAVKNLVKAMAEEAAKKEGSSGMIPLPLFPPSVVWPEPTSAQPVELSQSPTATRSIGTKSARSPATMTSASCSNTSASSRVSPKSIARR